MQAELNFGELGSENNQIAAPAAGITASPEAVALDDLGISIVPSSYISIEQTDGFVYVYTQESGTIPYVIVGYYNITAEDFTNQFTQYMAQEYSDLQVTSQESMITLNDREFSGIVYSYNVGGYQLHIKKSLKNRGLFQHSRECDKIGNCHIPFSMGGIETEGYRLDKQTQRKTDAVRRFPESSCGHGWC